MCEKEYQSSSLITGERNILVLSPKDNTATVVGASLKAGDSFRFDGLIVKAMKNIPFGHKVALCNIQAGEYIYKYGEIIGKATETIYPGDHVHTHNVEDVVDELRHQISSPNSRSDKFKE